MPLRLETENDPEVLRQAALLLERENQRLVARVVELTQQLIALKGSADAQQALQIELENLQKQLEQTQRRLYGPKSERRAGSDADQNDEQKAKKPGHGPRAQPKLPVVEREHLLDEADKICTACGKPLVTWEGQSEDSEEIDVIRRQFLIVKHKREKARCSCGMCIETAPAPLKLAPGARYSIDFAIEVATQKYDFHMPLSRQVREMAQQGLCIDSQTLWDQCNRLAVLLEPAWRALRQRCLQSPLLFADETTWRLLMSDVERLRRGAEDPDLKKKTWQVWTLVSADTVFYKIQGGRGLDKGKELLDGYEGTVMCDGYKVYTSLAALNPNLMIAHCWAHARRLYVEIQESYPTEVEQVLDLIGELYKIEARVPATGDAAELEARYKARQELSQPITQQIQQWCVTVKTLPGSSLAEAISYTANHWSGLIRFLDDPRIPLDNNTAERANRHPVVGRKNHYGSRSRRGTEVAAILYSLIETAKLCGLDASAYLRTAVHAALEGRPIPLPHDVRDGLVPLVERAWHPTNLSYPGQPPPDRPPGPPPG